MLFSFITLSLIALISLYSFILLVRTKFVVSGSFGGKLPSPIPPCSILRILVRTRWRAVREMDADRYPYIHRCVTARIRLCLYHLHSRQFPSIHIGHNQLSLLHTYEVSHCRAIDCVAAPITRSQSF